MAINFACQSFLKESRTRLLTTVPMLPMHAHSWTTLHCYRDYHVPEDLPWQSVDIDNNNYDEFVTAVSWFDMIARHA